MASVGDTAGPKAAGWLEAGAGRQRAFAALTRRVLLDGRIFWSLIALALAGGLAAQLSSLLNHDTAWYLYAGARLLEGARLYSDTFVEVNPPLGLYLTLPATALARWTGLSPVPVLVVYVYALIVLSLGAVWRLLRADDGAAPVLRRGLVLVAALVLTVCPADQFAQREHFLMILALPYLLLAALRVADPAAAHRLPIGVTAGIGAAAALGFALKPHYLLVPLALEAYRTALTRRPAAVLRPETLALAATGALYGASLPLFTPEYLDRILPYALEVYNTAYRNPLWINLWRMETVLLPLACLVHLATRPAQRAPVLTDVFLLSSAVFFVAYVVQMKGWSYHLYPASICLMLAYTGLFLNGLRVLEEPAEAPTNRELTPGIVLASLAVVVILIGSDAARGGYQNRFTDIMLPHVERHAAGGSIAILSPNVWPAFPLVNAAGVRWSSRFPTLWTLPGAHRQRAEGEADDPALLDEIERFTRAAVVADFTADPPDLVIVDNRARKSYFGDVPFDFLAFFLADPRFMEIWSDYEWVGDELGGDYRLYRRRSAGP